MQEPLQHDPRIKQQVKDAIHKLLYAGVQKSFKAQLDAIITRNTQMSGVGHLSFTYKNVLYSCDTAPAPRRMNRLLPALMPVMDSYLADLKKINDEEMPYVVGFINQVLNASSTLADYLRLFPEAVHEPVKALIATCPCHTKVLEPDAVATFLEKNQNAITMMKKRMVVNLIT